MHGLMLIGCGNMARVHCAQLKDMAEARLVCAADVLPERAQAFKTEYGFERSATDYRPELERTDIDVVLVATMWQPRYQIVLDCLRAGKHVLAEKPLSLRLDECDHMLQVARERGLKLRIDYILRVSPLMNRVKELLDAGAIGKPQVITMVHHQRGLQSDWPMMKRLMRGGVTPGIDCGIHICDLARWWLDAEARSAYSASARLDDDTDGANFTHSVFHMSNGAMVTMEECFSNNTNPRLQLAVYGDRGCIQPQYAADAKRPGAEDSINLWHGDDYRAETRLVPAAGKCTGAQMRTLLEDIRLDKDLAGHHEAVRRSTEMALAAFLSEQEGRVVPLPLSDADKAALHIAAFTRLP